MKRLIEEEIELRHTRGIESLIRMGKDRGREEGHAEIIKKMVQQGSSEDFGVRFNLY